MGKAVKRKMHLKRIIGLAVAVIWILRAVSAPASIEKYEEELGKFVNSGYVDYKNWSKNHEGLDEFIKSLESVVPESLSENESKAILINAYNAGMIWLILQNYPIEGVFDIKPEVFGQKAINIGGEMLSLDDIQNIYLRKTGDYRIHFAIVCGSQGCPDLASTLYDAETLDERLDDAARGYLSEPRGMVIEEENKVILLSMIFDWFGSDFGKTKPDIVMVLSRYLTDDRAEYLRENIGNVMIKYIDYDWSLNGD